MLLTAKELASALDVHITTIRRAYRSKRIPYERLCKLYFFDLEKVRSAMRQDGLDLIAPRDSRTRRATGGGSRRRAQPKRPRSVKRGLV
jgi:AcrR family transcriptional regulator